jgi:hypothetical protein
MANQSVLNIPTTVITRSKEVAPFCYFDQDIETPSNISPISFPSNWDFLQINGLTWPGIAVVSGFKQDWGWDHKKGKGASGHVSTYVGPPVAKGYVDFYMWTEYQYLFWQAVYQYLFTKSLTSTVQSGTTNASKLQSLAYQMIHPALNGTGMTQFVCASISQLKSVSDKDQTYKKCTVEMHTFNPPKVGDVTTTPQKATFNNGGIGSGPPIPTPEELAAGANAERRAAGYEAAQSDLADARAKAQAP